MVSDENELSIRSRLGLLRDLIPIYSVYQFLPNLLVLGLILWLGSSLGYFAFAIIMFGWVFQFMSRPSVMTVSQEQAAWLETVLEMQGFHDRSELDGRWRLRGKPWWQRWPHQSIELTPGDSVTLTAPRDVMESIRAGLEMAEEHGELSFAPEEEPFAFELADQSAEPERLPWHMHVPAALLGAMCVLAWIGQMFTSGSEGMSGWGVSSAALSQGRFETIFVHMFAHGGPMHLVMNMSMLAAIGGTLTERLGPTPLNWLRFLLLYFLSGLAGAALFLALHPTGTVPMLGASGALYGLFGLLIRAPANGGAMLPVTSLQIRRTSWDLIKQNAFLFALLALMSWSAGTNGGLAWETHLGGFLVGLFIGPKLLPSSAGGSSRATRPQEPSSEAFVPAD